jgi:hypothetical protein
MDKRNNMNRDAEANAQLKDLLNTWEVPPASSGLDRRTLAAYRELTARQPLWRRLLTFRIPLPVAFAGCALLVSVTAVTMHRPASSTLARVEIRTVTETKTVQVPVVQEKIVTQIIYRDRKPAPLTPSTPSRNDNQKLAVANEANGQDYLTNTELTGFQPNAEMSLKVIKRNAQNEK